MVRPAGRSAPVWPNLPQSTRHFASQSALRLEYPRSPRPGTFRRGNSVMLCGPISGQYVEDYRGQSKHEAKESETPGMGLSTAASKAQSVPEGFPTLLEG